MRSTSSRFPTTPARGRLVFHVRKLVRPVRRRLGAARAHAWPLAGHQSLILRLRDREALIAGDAIYYLTTLENEKRGFAMADEHLWRRSLREIQLYRRENPEALDNSRARSGTWDRLASGTNERSRLRRLSRRPLAATLHQPLDAFPYLRAGGVAVFGAGYQQARFGERAEQQVGERLDGLLLDQALVDQVLRRPPAPAPARSAPRFRATRRAPAPTARRSARSAAPPGPGSCPGTRRSRAAAAPTHRLRDRRGRHPLRPSPPRAPRTPPGRGPACHGSGGKGHPGSLPRGARSPPCSRRRSRAR